METQVQRPLSSPFPCPSHPETDRRRVCLAGLDRWRSGWPATRTEIEAAQALRYKVLSRKWAPGCRSRPCSKKRDFRHHRPVLRPSAGVRHRAWRRAETQIVGTYRLLARMWQSAMTGSIHKANSMSPIIGGPAPGQALPRARPLLRAAGIPHPADAGSAVAGQLGLCARAPDRRDVRMRVICRRQAACPCAGAVVSQRDRRGA
jgi:hypothetical protein